MLAFNSREFLKKFERANVLYDGANYADALQLYLELYSLDSTNLNLCYKIGACYLKHGKQHKKAAVFLEKSVKKISADYNKDDLKEQRAPLKALRLLADAYHLDNDFDRALLFYERYLGVVKEDKDAEESDSRDISRKVEMCITAKELIAHPVTIQLENMGNAINSVYPDYCPRLSADQQIMVFTSRRPTNVGGKTYDGGQYFEDIYFSVKKDDQWQPAQNIGWPVNTVGNEAAVAISSDGQEILIYKDDMGNGNIYTSCLDGDKWSTPVKLNPNINSPYWESSACISADGNVLFFVSDRPGGYGGSDIYKSIRQPGGDWGPAVNLGPVVNSPYDEYAPFLHADGVTLYFSSRGHKTMGGFDVFYSYAMDENTWAMPQNIGYPVNSSGDDVFFIASPDRKTAYYSSFRDDGLGEKDNYKIIFPSLPGSPVALLKGKVLDTRDRTPADAVITVTEKNSNKTGIYKPNPKTGEYLFVLAPGNYNISYEADGLLFYSLNQYVNSANNYTEQKKDIKLSPMDVGASVTLNNIYFDFDEATLKPSSRMELDKLFMLLAQNRDLSVQVKGYADSKGSDIYNRKLSYQRAMSVANYLVSKGIARDRVRPVGLGKESGEEPAGKGLNPSGRRVELKIIEVKNTNNTKKQR